jgi:hypothetical protein
MLGILSVLVFIIKIGRQNMYNKKMLFMSHLPTPRGGVEADSGRAGSGKTLNIWTLYTMRVFLLHCLRNSLNSLLLRLGCIFNSKWHYLNHNSICTTGQVLKINNIYAYEDDNDIDIVRLTDVHIERGYLYCCLFFTSKNKSITVRHTMQKGISALWSLKDKEEYDELMSRKLWYEVIKDEELLEFDF